MRPYSLTGAAVDDAGVGSQPAHCLQDDQGAAGVDVQVVKRGVEAIEVADAGREVENVITPCDSVLDGGLVPDIGDTYVDKVFDAAEVESVAALLGQ